MNASPVFQCGHPIADDNIAWNHGDVCCRTCRNRQQRESRQRIKDGIFPCGHLREAGNISLNRGKAYCRTCANQRQRARYDIKRGREPVMVEVQAPPRSVEHASHKLLAALWREHPAILERLALNKGAVVVRVDTPAELS